MNPTISLTITILASLVWGQEGAPQPVAPDTQVQPAEQRTRERRGDRRGREDRRRGDSDTERRDRWERFRTASPAERANLRAERLVEMTARTYDLDEAQRVMVRNEIAKMQAERRLEMGADAEKYDALREQMFEFWNRPDGNAETGAQENAASGDEDRREAWRARRERMREMRRDPAFQDLRRQMDELEQKYPIDWDAAASRVESLLPPEQAERGRARREQWMARREERRSRWNSDNVPIPRPAPTTPRLPDGPTLPPLPDAPNAAPGAAPARPQPPAPPKPLHPWEEHVRRFIDQNELSPAQANSAMAVLRDIQARAAQLEAAHAARTAEAMKIRDPAKRAEALNELKKPHDELFEALKQRLDGLLTAEQRRRAGK